jgi:hypothetical protein
VSNNLEANLVMVFSFLGLVCDSSFGRLRSILHLIQERGLYDDNTRNSAIAILTILDAATRHTKTGREPARKWAIYPNLKTPDMKE